MMIRSKMSPTTFLLMRWSSRKSPKDPDFKISATWPRSIVFVPWKILTHYNILFIIHSYLNWYRLTRYLQQKLPCILRYILVMLKQEWKLMEGSQTRIPRYHALEARVIFCDVQTIHQRIWFCHQKELKKGKNIANVGS